MYRLLVLLSISLVFMQNCAFASRTVVTTRPVYNPYYNQCNNNYHHHNPYYNMPHAHTYNHNHMYRPTTFHDIGALEKYSLNRNYGRESNLQRLQRLEMQAFGAVQSGDIDTRYDNVRNAILSRPNYTNTKTSLLRNIGNYFGGQMTGFTPSLTSDPFFSSSQSFYTTPYPSTYGNTNVTQYSSPFGGNGYRINNYGTGSSSGIKILD